MTFAFEILGNQNFTSVPEQKLKKKKKDFSFTTVTSVSPNIFMIINSYSPTSAESRAEL